MAATKRNSTTESKTRSKMVCLVQSVTESNRLLYIEIDERGTQENETNVMLMHKLMEVLVHSH